MFSLSQILKSFFRISNVMLSFWNIMSATIKALRIRIPEITEKTYINCDHWNRILHKRLVPSSSFAGARSTNHASKTFSKKDFEYFCSWRRLKCVSLKRKLGAEVQVFSSQKRVLSKWNEKQFCWRKQFATILTGNVILLGHGQLVNLLAFYSNNPSLNPTEFYNFFLYKRIWK